jgi:hypothetical protein
MPLDPILVVVSCPAITNSTQKPSNSASVQRPAVDPRGQSGR